MPLFPSIISSDKRNRESPSRAKPNNIHEASFFPYKYLISNPVFHHHSFGKLPSRQATQLFIFFNRIVTERQGC